MEKNYNNGIELLRIFSMFFIVLLHILGNGGILYYTQPLSAKYFISWLIEMLAYCAVNCYALITGYLMVQKKFRLSRGILLWLQVVFYTLGITLIFWVISPDSITISRLLDALFPVFRKHYWYFTAYFALLFCMPFINILLNQLSKRQFQWFIIGVFTAFSLLPALFHTDVFLFNNGYSLWWLICLYCIGAYLRLYGEQALQHIHKSRFFFGYLFCTLAVYGIWITGSYLSGRWAELPGIRGTISPIIQKYANQFFTYTSPFVLLAAVFLFLFSLRIIPKKVTSIKIIRFFSATSFGVYLIHCQSIIYDDLIHGFFGYLLSYPLWQFLVMIFIWACSIYLGCSIIDFLRSKLFTFLSISEKAKKVSANITQLHNKKSN